MTDLIDQLLTEEEGRSSPTVYADTKGFWTLARGVCVDGRVPGAGLPQAAIAAANEVRTGEAAARAGALPGFAQCNDVRQAVLVSMCYQLGTLADWPRFKAALAAGNYSLAADEMLYQNPQAEPRAPSAWVIETPARAKRAAEMMRSGVWVEK